MTECLLEAVGHLFEVGILAVFLTRKSKLLISFILNQNVLFPHWFTFLNFHTLMPIHVTYLSTGIICHRISTESEYGILWNSHRLVVFVISKRNPCQLQVNLSLSHKMLIQLFFPFVKAKMYWTASWDQSIFIHLKSEF